LTRDPRLGDSGMNIRGLKLLLICLLLRYAPAVWARHETGFLDGEKHCEIATHRSKPISAVCNPRITSLAEMQIVSFYKNNPTGRFIRRAMATHREKHE
jgi:hypothetical protein